MKIALLGYGVVGSGVYELIVQNQERFKIEYEQDVEIVGILVNNLEKYKHLIHFSLFTNVFEDIFSREFDIAIETIGGIEPAFSYVDSILKCGKSVITSNKDLIAEKGAMLHASAQNSNAELRYEASVGGGIPILKPIRECLAGDRIIEITGIINGTTNFILTKMNQEGLSYDAALALAQSLGFAEADPTSDVEGLDAVRKLSILTKIGLKCSVDWKTIPTEGITKISASDVEYLKESNKVIKLLGIAKLTDEGLYTAVRPVVLEKSSKFAGIDNEFNAVSVTGESVGALFFSGKGAGKFPTATAVLGDLVDLLQNKKNKINDTSKATTILSHLPGKNNWFLRISQTDAPSVFDLLNKNLKPENFTLTFSADGSIGYILLSDLTELELVDLKHQIGDCEFKCYPIFK